MMNINPLELRLRPFEISDDNYMKARVRQDLNYVKECLARAISNDYKFIEALVQNAEIRTDEHHYNKGLLVSSVLYIVPAMQVISERQRMQAPQYNGERVINRTWRQEW
jgi:hypothetical protein